MKTRIALIALISVASTALNAQTIMNIHQSNGTVLQIPINTIDSITYTMNGAVNLATVITTDVTSITGTTAISGGNVTADGGSIITQRGVCYSTAPSPTITNEIVISASGSGSYTVNLSGLVENTVYYIRAYAINSAGVAYGNELNFLTDLPSELTLGVQGAGVTFDNFTYSSVVYGNGQEWISENLRTTVYANGDPIPNITDNFQWQGLSTGAWAHYNNDSQFENPYGKLYNHFTVVDPRGLCPVGWHVPTNDEWTSYAGYLGQFGAPVGGVMKSTGTQFWGSPNTGATNASGFSGLPGGYRGGNAYDESIGLQGNWWSYMGTNSWWGIPEPANQAAYCNLLGHDTSSLYNSQMNRFCGLSVRCIKD